MLRPGRVVEQEFRPRRPGPKLRFRVDLHGISLFGPGDERTLIRWEWLEEVRSERGLAIRSASEEINLPGGAFGLPAEKLAELLWEARSPDRRVAVISELGGKERPGP